MKTFIIFGLILTQVFPSFSQKPPQPVKTATVAPTPAENDTLSFAYLTDKNGKPIMDSSDCFLIGDLEAGKLLVFPVPSSAADIVDDFLFVENTKAKQHVAYYKCIVPKGSSGGARYREIQKTLETKLRIKLKMPNLRIRLVWAPGISDENANLNFVEK